MTDHLPPAAPTPPTPPSPVRSLAPFGVPVFRVLWIAGLVSNIGSWMQTVGAQWLLVDSHSSPAVIALVQTASAAPVLLLAIPAGVIGELLDRRRILIVSQVAQFAVVTVLVVLTWLGETTPAVLLIVTFILGACAAVQLPSYQAIIPDVVPSRMIPAAASLSSVGVNIARAIGPAVAGLVVAQLGVTAVFIANAVSFGFFLVVLLLWRGYRPPPSRPEPFLDATRAGLRYVRHAGIVRRYYLRLLLFLLPANALWALLPVLASGRFGLDAGGYGLMLGALGAGSIVGALILPSLRRRAGAGGTIMIAFLLYGVACVALPLIPSIWAALVALILAGMGWIGVLATFNGTVQAFLPPWVRTRGLSVYQLVLFGGTAAGAALAGLLGGMIGSVVVVVVAGACVIALGLVQLVWRLPSTEGIGRAIVTADGVHDRDGASIDPDSPVVVVIRYVIPDDALPEFLATMAQLRESRRRTGARMWRLLQDPLSPGSYSETYSFGTWREHDSQVRARTTEYDEQLSARARALSAAPVVVAHYLVADVPSGTRRAD
ncbi:MAG: MFS transporter [Microbacterium sp.]|uniref:MFS transporter n=2 Tax=Microbacterium sp. TaxID=51671 RepID=UPI001AC5273D|nr:MFS transporter [Microbacterium sp.]MBN9155354.1 MFS transporter [Microbacterium sp.]